MTGRLFGHVLTIQVRKHMSYRGDFWINSICSFFAELAIMYYLWRAIFAESGRSEIHGYSFESMVLYYVVAILLGKVIRGNERDLTISTDIYEGGLTRYLLYPSSFFGFKYAEHLGTLLPPVVQLVVFGVLSTILFSIPPDVHITPATAGMAFVSVAVSNVLHFALLYPIQLVAFWADNVWSLNVMFRFACMMLGGLLLPLNLFPQWMQPFLQVLPFRFLYYVPASTLLGRVGVTEWLTGLLVSVVWIVAISVATRIVWRRGTLQYTGVGI